MSNESMTMDGNQGQRPHEDNIKHEENMNLFDVGQHHDGNTELEQLVYCTAPTCGTTSYFKKDPAVEFITLPNKILQAQGWRQNDELLSEPSSSSTDDNSSSSSSSSCSDKDEEVDSSTGRGTAGSGLFTSVTSANSDGYIGATTSNHPQKIQVFHSFSIRQDQQDQPHQRDVKNQRRLRQKTVTFALTVFVHTVPRITADEWSLVHYEKDEIAEFRYEAFLEDCGLSGSS